MTRHRARLAGGVLLFAVMATAIPGGRGQGADQIQDQYAFMPDGGRIILTALLTGRAADEMTGILSRTASAAEWAEWAGTAQPGLDADAVATVAAYAELNLPLSGDAFAGSGVSELPEILPPDGKDLAVMQCQFCHSLFSGYLMHDRDRTGWEGTFKSPFHTEIPMTETERKTFAAYSAINMPLPVQDVPPELRF